MVDPVVERYSKIHRNSCGSSRGFEGIIHRMAAWLAVMDGSSINRKIIAASIAIGVFSPLLWMLMDRDPAVIRLSAEVVGAPAEKCGQSEMQAPDGLVPGGCAQVNWTVIALRSCKPNKEFNVTRNIIDSRGGRHELPSRRVEFPTPSTPRREPLKFSTYFTIPLTVPGGPTEYQREMCCAHNPLQMLIAPVCVGEPRIKFDIESNSAQFRGTTPRP